LLLLLCCATGLSVVAPSKPLHAEYATTIEIVEAGTLNQNSPIRFSLDSASIPHIAYWATDWSIRYARREGGAWTIETAFDGVGATLQFDVEPNGTAHLLRNTGEGPIYAVHSGGAWTSEQLFVPGGESVSGVSALELDAQGNPHVTYWSLDCGIDCDARLLYGRKAAGSWTTDWLWSCLFDGSRGAVGVDATGGSHFLVSCGSGEGAMYIAWNASEWRPLPDVSEYTQAGFIIEPNGSPHVVYASASSYRPQYAHRPGGVWTFEMIDAVESDGGAIAVDGSGAAHVAYHDTQNGDLVYARRANGIWTRQVVDGVGADVGAKSGIAVDADGRVHIAYYDATNGALKYATIDYAPTTVSAIPQDGVALRATPNPSRGPVDIVFGLERGDAADLVIYDVGGRRIRSLISGSIQPGIQSATWDRLDSSGRLVAPGTYFLRLTSSRGDQVTERVTVVR